MIKATIPGTTIEFLQEDMVLDLTGCENPVFSLDPPYPTSVDQNYMIGDPASNSPITVLPNFSTGQDTVCLFTYTFSITADPNQCIELNNPVPCVVASMDDSSLPV